MTRVRRLVTYALAAYLTGCAGAESSETLAERRQGIVDGVASGADQDGVLLLRVVLPDENELLCSSSLVAPNLILTARHCVSYLKDGPFSCSVRGELLENPTGAGRLGLHLPAASIEVHGRKTPRGAPLAHGVQVLSTLAPTICENDVAFVVLDTALTLPVVPLRLGRPARTDEATLLVGYGLDARQTGIDYRSQPRRQKRDLRISAVGPDSIADGVTTVPPRQLVLLGPSGCIGDSGGPLLSQQTGAVLGVYSLEEGESCAAAAGRHLMVHVPPFETLIEQAFAAAGAEPLLEKDPNAGSDAGAGPIATAGGAGSPATSPSDAAGAPGSPDPSPTLLAEHDAAGCRFAPARADEREASALITFLAFGSRRRRKRNARQGARSN